MQESRLIKDKLSLPEILNVTTPQVVREYFNFADPILGVNWGEQKIPAEYTPEYIASHSNETQIFVIRDENGKIIAGEKVQILSDETKARLGLNMNVFANKQGALLEYLAVREDKRRQGLPKILLERQIEWVKDHKAEYVCAEIEITNPISAHTHTTNGFVFIGIQKASYGIPELYLVAVRSVSKSENLSSVSKKDTDDSFLQKEIQVTKNSEDELESLFRDGWIGVDAKMSAGNSGFWTLVLRKKKI